MKYIVLDLEFNRANNRYKSIKNGIALRAEIMEIGAVKLNDKLEQEDTFCTYVRPTAYSKVNNEVKKLTEISNDMIWNGKRFETAIHEFLAWCGDDSVFISWSENDMHVIEDNMLYHGMDIANLPECYDIQLMFDDQISMYGKRMQLAYALWKLDIKVKTDQMHDALCDALNTAEIFRKLDLTDGLLGYEVY